MGSLNRGVKTAEHAVTKRSNMPASLVEVGFINSDIDNRLFDENFQDIAEAIARGILETLPEQGGIHEKEEYGVQVGSFRNERYAQRLLRELREEGFPAYIERYGEYNRVRVGDDLTMKEAIGLERRLKRKGYPTVIVN